jgi:predicted MFS family arabinose efflux permease
MMLFAIGLAVMASSTQRWVVVVATALMGCGWMVTLTTLNTSAQMNLASRMRARGMSCYLTVMALSMSGGSFLWGSIAESMGIGSAQKIAAVTVLVTAAIGLLFPVSKPRQTA